MTSGRLPTLAAVNGKKLSTSLQEFHNFKDLCPNAFLNIPIQEQREENNSIECCIDPQ